MTLRELESFLIRASSGRGQVVEIVTDNDIHTVGWLHYKGGKTVAVHTDNLPIYSLSCPVLSLRHIKQIRALKVGPWRRVKGKQCD